jgi:hypothetical protein
MLWFDFKTLDVDLKLNSNSAVHKPVCHDGIKAHANLPANVKSKFHEHIKQSCTQNVSGVPPVPPTNTGRLLSLLCRLNFETELFGLQNGVHWRQLAV